MTDYIELQSELVAKKAAGGQCTDGLSIDTILALIAEIERLEGRLADEQDRVMSVIGQYAHIETERDQLKAEFAGLRTGFDAQNEVIAGLKKDAARLDWIEENYTGHGGGTEFNLRLRIPCDFETGQLRHGIDAAMSKGEQS